jgi:hypothetical protein
MTPYLFDHKHILLTGAGGGLGSAMVKLLERVDRKIASLRDKVIGKKSLKNRPWRLFQVESAIACNLKCIMCPWREIAKKATDHGIMTPEIWKAIRPYLSGSRMRNRLSIQRAAAYRSKIKKNSGCRH